MVSMERKQFFSYLERLCPQKIHEEINTLGLIEKFEKCNFVKIIKVQCEKVNEADFLQKLNNLIA